MKIRILTVLSCFLVATTLSAKSVNQSFDVRPGGTLTVEAKLGSIEVSTSATNTIDVRLNATGSHADEVTINFEQDKNDLIVTSDYSGPRNWGRQPRVQFMITIPKEYNVKLKTGGGSISVDDLNGSTEVKTSGGSLTLGHIEGPVHAKTSGGSISLKGSMSLVDLDTSGGSITVGDVNGAVKAKTSGGSVRIGRVMGTVDAHSSGGSVHLKEATDTVNLSTSGGGVSAFISQQPSSDCRLTTSGGSVTVELAAGVGVDLQASTSSGGVHSDFDVTNGHQTKKSISGKINGGGPELYVHTSGGSVHIERRKP